MHWLLLSPDTLSVEERRQFSAVLSDNWDRIPWEVTKHSWWGLGSLHLWSESVHLRRMCFNQVRSLQTQCRAMG